MLAIRLNNLNQKTWDVVSDEGDFVQVFDEFNDFLSSSINEMLKKEVKIPQEAESLSFKIRDVLDGEVAKLKADFGKILSLPLSDNPAVKTVLHQIDMGS